MSNRTLTLDDALYRYVLEHSLREHPVLAALREVTARMPEHEMQIAPEQGQFMALLVRLIGARRTLDIGVFTGYSALAVALALPDDGRVLGCDVSEAYTRVARADADADTAAIQAFNDKLHRDDRVDLSLLPLADGLTLARKR